MSVWAHISQKEFPMKKKLIFGAMLVCLLALGLALAGCDDGSGARKLTITNNYSSPVTHVKIETESVVVFDADDTIAANGGTKEYDMAEAKPGFITVEVTFQDGTDDDSMGSYGGGSISYTIGTDGRIHSDD
jgi:hypothetical protein